MPTPRPGPARPAVILTLLLSTLLCVLAPHRTQAQEATWDGTVLTRNSSLHVRPGEYTNHYIKLSKAPSVTQDDNAGMVSRFNEGATMSNRKLSMRKIREILRLKWCQGLSNRQIAGVCGIAHPTISAYLRRTGSLLIGHFGYKCRLPAFTIARFDFLIGRPSGTTWNFSNPLPGKN